MIFTVVPCRPKESFFPWAKIKFVLKFIVRDKKNGESYLPGQSRQLKNYLPGQFRQIKNHFTRTVLPP